MTLLAVGLILVRAQYRLLTFNRPTTSFYNTNEFTDKKHMLSCDLC